MDNPDAGGSGGSGRRQSSLPSSLIPLMYKGPQQQRGSASPSESENPGSAGNPPSSTTKLPSITPSPTPALTLRPIDSSSGTQTPERRQVQTSRLPSEAPDAGGRETRRAGPSPIGVDPPSETRLGGEPPTYGFRPPPGTEIPTFTFPPVPRFQHMPYPYYGEGEAGPSNVPESSGGRSASRRTATRTMSRPVMSTWPQSDQGRSASEGTELRKLSDEKIWHEEQQRQRRRPEIRPSRISSQERESIAADPPSIPPSAFPNPPIAPLQGPQPENQGSEAFLHSPMFFGNPYVGDTQSFTPISPQHFPRYYDPMQIVTLPPPGQGHQMLPEPFTPTEGQSQSHGSEEETSVKSRRQGKRKAEEGSIKKTSRRKAKQARSVDDELDDEDDDDTPRRKVSRKTEVACDFCRRRKLRCDGVRPICRTCETRKELCTYVTHVRRRGPGKAPKGSRKLAKQRDNDPFTTMMDLSFAPTAFVGRPESVGSDTVPRYSPPIAGTMYQALSRSPSRLQLRGTQAPHMPSQSPVASTSEREPGPSRRRRPQKRSASQRDSSKRTRRDADETDDTSHDPPDDDMSYDGQPPP